jgi:hypothetical protein
MLKNELFHSAMKAGRYMDPDWLISGFSITREKKKPDTSNEEAGGVVGKPWDIVSDMSGYYYLDDQLSRLPIEDGKAGAPLYNLYDKIQVKPGDAPNIKKEAETDFGNLIFNWIILVHTFGDLFDFVPADLTIKQVLKWIEPIFEDELEDPTKKEKGKVYPSDYLKFSDCVFYLPSLSQLVTVSITEIISTPADGISEYKAGLFKKYEGRLEDPIAVAEIEKALIDFDAKYREGDPGNRFVYGNKPIKVVRKKATIIFGAEPHPSGDPSKVLLIKNSLDEGLELENLPTLVDSLRSGAYGRGQETMMGGVAYKDLVRALSGLTIEDGFCGTKLGLPVDVKESDLHRLVGSSILGGVPRLLGTTEEAGQYLGKVIMVSSPQYCKAPPYKYCRTCMGETMWKIKASITQAGAAVGQGFLGVFMSAMHGKVFAVAEINLMNDLM